MANPDDLIKKPKRKKPAKRKIKQPSEPIFKLLATNHVQLIVPARGATPAITGRFDVNYILGQKLVDSRQQTVVVDYYSSTKESELEYTRMDYEQATFDFL